MELDWTPAGPAGNANSTGTGARVTLDAYDSAMIRTGKSGWVFRRTASLYLFKVLPVTGGQGMMGNLGSYVPSIANDDS